MSATAEKIEIEESGGLSLPIELPARENALETFTDTEKLQPYLDAIAERARSLVPDMTTVKGRKAIASNAANVAKSKTALDAVGKELVDEYKEIPKKIDAGRKLARDFLDALKEEVRKPLTDWEAEQARIKAEFERRINDIKSVCHNIEGANSEQLRRWLNHADSITVDESWGEYQGEAATALLLTQKTLRDALAKREAFEAEQAAQEAERQRLAEERRQIELEKAKQEAADKARADAEAKAKADQEAAQRREIEARMAQERAERDAEAAKQREEKAKADAAAQAERAAQAAAEAERKRIADEEAAKAAEEKRRQEDQEHRAAINRAALADLMALELDEATAKRILIGIIQGKVANVSVRY